jgi:hypothetical protein
MRKLSLSDQIRIQEVIDRNRERLLSVPNVLTAEPGFPLIGGKLVREPAIVLFVANKLLPAQLLPEDYAPDVVEGIRVDVMQAGPRKQIELDPRMRALRDATEIAAAATVSYEGIPGEPIDESFVIEKPILCSVGPDVGWSVLREFIQGTRKSLSVAMYDFSADYVSNALIEVARANNVKVALTIDDGLKDAEKAIQERLASKLGALYESEIIRCRKSMRFPSAYHEKVAVQDHMKFWLSSGNWSPNSQPNIDPVANPGTGWFSKGNREWHVVVEDAELAGLFERYIEHDKSQSEGDAALAIEDGALAFPDLFVSLDGLISEAALAVPDPVAPETVLSGASTVIRPLLSPDNYAKRISEWIRGATISLDLQYSYIHYSAVDGDKDFKLLLDHLGRLSWKEGFRR